jgi:hypothetical protein
MKMLANNERFAKMAGVSRPKVSSDFQVLHPVPTAVNPSLRQAARTLLVSGTVQFSADSLAKNH